MSENPYQRAASALMREHNVIVKLPYRKHTTGVAYVSERKIETPKPTGPVSFGTFAHEVGHVACEHGDHRVPRWHEETEAWQFAMEQFERYGLRGYDRAYLDACRALA